MAAALAAKGKLWSCAGCRDAGLQKMRACDEDARFPVYEIDGEKFFRCPVGFMTNESADALRMYGFYIDGHLPQTGGFLDQDNRIMEQMQIISSAVNEAREKKQ